MNFVGQFPAYTKTGVKLSLVDNQSSSNKAWVIFLTADPLTF